jgi:DNA mismatch repair protein MutS2
LPKKDTEETPSEVNIIGLTVDEALPVVDKFIDQALFHGLEKVQVIHGIGLGRLRNAISKYLREHPRVKRYALGDPAKGGGGVTFVDLS